MGDGAERSQYLHEDNSADQLSATAMEDLLEEAEQAAERQARQAKDRQKRERQQQRRRQGYGSRPGSPHSPSPSHSSQQHFEVEEEEEEEDIDEEEYEFGKQTSGDLAESEEAEEELKLGRAFFAYCRVVRIRNLITGGRLVLPSQRHPLERDCFQLGVDLA